MLKAGQCIGPYAVTEQIGQGGQAVVWSGHHQHTGKQVAIKVLTTLSEDARARFEQEARTQAGINCTHVVRIEELLRVGKLPAIVMERIRGPTLTRLLRERTPSPQQIDQLVDGICQGVMSAHANGLIHRDIKPSNVLIHQEDGRLLPKLTDFGIVKHVAMSPDMVEVTGTGMVLGTPGFMAPEQCKGWTDLDARADVFGVGCLLYQLVTGRRPFKGTSRLMVMVATCEGLHTPADVLVPDLPEHRALAISSALQPNRDNRIQHIDTLRELWHDRLPQSVVRSIAKRAKITSDDRPTPKPEPTDSPKILSADLGGELFGRKRQTRQLAEDIQDNPLVTVVGLGGSGKTRLALAAAQSLHERTGMQINLADMTHVQSREACLSMLASGLGIPLSGRDPEEQLRQTMTLRNNALFMIDNAETAMQWLQPLLRQWLSCDLGVHLMMTSRHPTHLQGEHIHRVDPLPIGAGVELFKSKASRLGANSATLPIWDPVIEDIVRQLDSLPLAIELAAARTQQLSPSQILEGLCAEQAPHTDQDSTSLQDGLRSVLEDTYAQLPPWSRLAWAQCSVFRGGFGIRAAESVIDLSAWPEAPDVMDVIHSLMDHSLLISRRSHTSGARVQMLDTIRAFGKYKMARAGQADKEEPSQLTGPGALLALQRRHADYYRRFGTQNFARQMHTQGGQHKRASLHRERENILKAAAFAAQSEDYDLAYECATAMARIYTHLGPFAAGADRLSKMRKLIDPAGMDAVRMDLALGHLHQKAGLLDEALRFTSRAGQKARAIGDHVMEGVAIKDSAFLYWLKQDLEKARKLADKAGELLAHMDQVTVPARRLHAIATVTEIGQERHHHPPILKRVLARARQDGDGLLAGSMLGKLAKREMQAGRLNEGRLLLQEAIQIAKKYRSLEREAMATSNLASLDFVDGKLEQALHGNARAISLNQYLGYEYGHFLDHGNRGEILIELGRLEEAESHLRTAITSKAIGAAEWAFRGALAWIEGQKGDRKEATAKLQQCIDALAAIAPWESTKLMCKQGEIQLLAGRMADAQSTLEAAQAQADQLSTPDGSDLYRAIQRLKSQIGAHHKQ